VELIVAVLHTLKFLLPKAFLIFGVCCGIIEFLIRDKEIDAIRNTFIWLWIQTDAISKLSLMTAVASKRGQVAFKICAILTFLAYQGFLLVTRQLSGGFDFKDFTGSDYAYVLALSLIPLLLSTGVFYLIRRDVEDYVYYCISGTFIDALFRFSIIPVLSSLVALIYVANRSELTTSVTAWGVLLVTLLAFVTLTYLTSLWFFVVLLALVYFPTRLILLMLNRLCLRIAESTRGPVLAISSIFAIGGAILEMAVQS
jgi:hypothetical protein